MPSSLTQLFPKRQLVTDPVELITYEIDAGFDRGKPDGVFYPQSTNDVQRIMRWASENGTPLIARGAGTGLSGGAVPEHGGIIVEFARLNRVLEFDVLGRGAVVEPGVINLVLDGLVKKEGLYYPPDPSSGRSSTIGGNLGENAGGPHCFKYGVTTNYITGLEVVLADGQVLRLGGRAFDYPEYDLLSILVGSEGTLGIITRADVRLIRNPPGVKTMMAAFTSLEAAGAAVSAVIAAGLVPATLEMMDQKVMGMIESYAAPGLPVDFEAALIVEVDGYPAGLDAQMEEVADILVAHGAQNLRIAQSEEERAKIWYGRKSAAGAVARLAPTFYLVDVTVPRSCLAETLAEVNAICDKYDLRTGHVFHAGDGNLHPLILCDARNPELMERVFRACDEIVALCIARDGSITGEHGVGIEKRKYMPAMYNGAELSAMLDLKHLLDPRGLLNPGKVFPPDVPMPQHCAPVPPAHDPFAPETVEEAAAGLAALSAEGRRVRIGSASEGPRAGADLWLATEKLRGVRRFALSDLYVTVGAGTTVAELQQFLGQHGMMVPLAAPWPQATLGGIVATNFNAPLRMRYGAIRDVMLSTTAALADGRIVRAGRNVVKNAAGYDLPKLFVGSYGTLGVLTEMTFKLTPKPRAQRTFAVPINDAQDGVNWALKVLSRLCVASGLVLVPSLSIAGEVAAPFALLVTMEGTAEDVAAEVDEMTTALWQAGGPRPTEIQRQTSTEAWSNFLSSTPPDALLVRVGVPSKDLALYITTLTAQAHDRVQWFIDVANGLAYAYLTPDSPEAAENWLAALRMPALTLGGYTLALQMPAALRTMLDPWGYQPSSLAVMRTLKATWDPANILNPGDFVVG